MDDPEPVYPRTRLLMFRIFAALTAFAAAAVAVAELTLGTARGWSWLDWSGFVLIAALCAYLIGQMAAHWDSPTP
jgi:hypothetical protein